MIARSPRPLRSLARAAAPAAALALATLTVGCSMTVGAVNPRPNVVVPAGAPRYSVDVSRVRDHVELDRVTIEEFQTTLRRGFANAVGSRLATPQAEGSVVLVLDSVEPELSNMGALGRFVTLRFRARWLAPDGHVVAELAGVAMPRNPTETGSRHLEDVVEVMIEKTVAGLDAALHDERPRAPASRSHSATSTRL